MKSYPPHNLLLARVSDSPPLRDPKRQALFLVLLTLTLNAGSSLGMVRYGDLWHLRVEFAFGEKPHSEGHSCKPLNLGEIRRQGPSLAGWVHPVRAGIFSAGGFVCI